MTSYDKSFDPPAPVISVALTGTVSTRPRVRVAAIIDTGSDVTAIPLEFVNRLKLYALRRLVVEDVSAAGTEAFTYGVRLAIPGGEPKRMEVILTGFPFVVLGRDWLEDYYLLLEGPKGQFQLSGSPLT